MRFFLLVVFFVFTAATCHKNTTTITPAPKLTSNCFKARLEIKGICMNYVIKVLDGDITKPVNLGFAHVAGILTFDVRHSKVWETSEAVFQFQTRL